MMHVRINVPYWRRKELISGAIALLLGDQVRGMNHQLRREMESTVLGWSPILVSSGRYGIATALRILELEGKRVAIPGYACQAILPGLQAARAEIVPVDCEHSSIRFDPKAIVQVVANKEVDAILALNTYGLDQDYSLLSTLGVPIIEDAAYQAGLFEPNTNIWCGTRGNIGIWSFNFKALTGIGGGVVWVRQSTDNDTSQLHELRSRDLSEIMRFANYALRSVAGAHIPSFLPGARSPKRGETARVPLRMQTAGMSDLQALIILRQWQCRHEILQRQRANNIRIAETIAHCEAFSALAYQKGATLPHLFPILVRSDLADVEAVFRARIFLHKRGIQTENPYPILEHANMKLPNALHLSRRLLLIPCNASLGDHQLQRITSSLLEASRIVLKA